MEDMAGSCLYSLLRMACANPQAMSVHCWRSESCLGQNHPTNYSVWVINSLRPEFALWFILHGSIEQLALLMLCCRALVCLWHIWIYCAEMLLTL